MLLERMQLPPSTLLSPAWCLRRASTPRAASQSSPGTAPCAYLNPVEWLTCPRFSCPSSAFTPYPVCDIITKLCCGCSITADAGTQITTVTACFDRTSAYIQYEDAFVCPGAESLVSPSTSVERWVCSSFARESLYEPNLPSSFAVQHCISHLQAPLAATCNWAADQTTGGCLTLAGAGGTAAAWSGLAWQIRYLNGHPFGGVTAGPRAIRLTVTVRVRAAHLPSHASKMSLQGELVECNPPYSQSVGFIITPCLRAGLCWCQGNGDLFHASQPHGCQGAAVPRAGSVPER